MTQKTTTPVHAREPATDATEPFDPLSADEFEVTMSVDESGDPERFHITSISPRPRH
jgi:hypothetical protein